IEKHAASVYTRRTFKKFINEMRLQQLYFHEYRIDDEPFIRVYYLIKYGDLSEWIRVEFHVDDDNIKCSCLKFVTKGIPCPHIIHVMILEQLNRIPLTLIMKRWTKNAKDDAPVVVDNNVDPQYQRMLRCFLDDNDVDVYERNKKVWPFQLGTFFGGDSSEDHFHTQESSIKDLTKEGIIDSDGEVLARGKGTYKTQHSAITGFERVTGKGKAALPPTAAYYLLTSYVMGSDSDG
ncbi:uncharacterized protein LOC110428595, partial [Herrania umbratica]|uniref:Protein FAR1-RELATED SEQUENCE n=1 Tax=Herrania umbratica TaxID=108875 RepID=A0A6J1BKZ4_9ROSI